MSLTQNNLDDVFKTALNRPATPFEYDQFKNKSIATLGNIGQQYNSLNKDNSISDYLRYSGQDSSMAARATLAQQQGIAGYTGTADQNTNLLNSLKAKNNPVPTTPDYSGGAVNPNLKLQVQTGNTPTNPLLSSTLSSYQNTQSQITQIDDALSKSLKQKTDQTGNTPNGSGTQGSTDTLTPTPTSPINTGSVYSAAQSAPQPAQQSPTYTPPTPKEFKANPLLDSTLSSYKGIQTQISQIDDALAKSLKQKTDQVTASGGIVNNAQLLGEVQAENAPLLTQRKELANQQSSIGKTYQQILASDKQGQSENDKQNALASSNYNVGYKENQQNSQFNLKQTADAYKLSQTEADRRQTIDQGQQRIDQTQSKSDIQQQQFEQKFAQSGIKKISDYSDGSKVGEHFVNVSTGKKVNVNSSTGELIGTGSSAGSSNVTYSSPSGLSQGKIVYKDFAANGDAPDKDNINTVYPGVAGKTYGTLYQDAISFSQTGKYLKSGRTNAPSAKAYDTAVRNKASNIASSLGMNSVDLQALYTGNEKALSALIKQKATVSAFENKAKAQVDMILNGYVDPITKTKKAALIDGASNNDLALANTLFQKGRIQLNDTPAVLLSNALLTFTTEYAKIISGSTGSAAGSSDAAQAHAATLINQGMSQGTIRDVLGLLQKEMDTTIDGYNTQIKSTTNDMSLGSQSTVPAQSTQPIQPTSIPDGYYQASDGLLYKK